MSWFKDKHARSIEVDIAYLYGEIKRQALEIDKLRQTVNMLVLEIEKLAFLFEEKNGD